MQDWYNFILKIKPDGKAFQSLFNSKIFYQVLANALNIVKEYAVLMINDQVWYVNSNFDPISWEKRFLINVPVGSTLDERRQIVKSYMLFPKYSNRLSKDYIQNSLHDAGFNDLLIEYNPTNIDDGILRVNDFTDEKLTFDLGDNDYNQFVVSGNINEIYYNQSLKLIMSLKPLQVGFYDKINIFSAIAIDNSLAIALDYGLIYMNKFGTFGNADGQLKSARGISINDSLIYISDTENHRIQIFDLSGNFVSKFGTYGTANGQFNYPSGISVTDNYIYVIDSLNSRVQIFTKDGNFVSKFGSIGSGDGQFNQAFDIHVTSSNIYVADSGNHRIQIFDLSGTYISKFGSIGSGNGQFNAPRGLYVTGTNIYVTDAFNTRVQIFDLSGTYVSKFGSIGSGDGQFNSPFGIIVNSNIYVTDWTNNNVQIFDLSGNFLSKFGSSGTGDGQFNRPGYLEYLESNIYLTDILNNRVQMLEENNYTLTLTVI